MTLDKSIIDEIDAVIGDNVNDLHKSALLLTKYQDDLRELEAQLSLTDNDTPTELKKCLNIYEENARDVGAQRESLAVFEDKINSRLERYEIILKNVSSDLSKVRELQKILQYFNIMSEIQDISNELKNCAYGKDNNKVVKLYVKLCGDELGTKNLLQIIHDVDAPNLQLYGRSTALYWHNVLKDKFSKDFEAILKGMKWPQFGQSLETFSPSKDNLSKLNNISENLFCIKIPGDQALLHVKITPTIICAPISMPVELLLKPFRQRFQYHFTGQRQTNRYDKPEWYFTQILNWGKENHIFVGKNFQSAALNAGLKDLNVRIEFIRGLVQFSIEKLCYDIDNIVRNEALFAHLIDEILAFEQELRSMLGYPSSLPSAITVITQAQYLVKWLSIEERFTTEKMDTMLKTGDPWECLDPTNLDELKIPKCADHFIRLLDAIKERYCCLPQPGHQLQFLHLQLELIENFRRRLVQLHNSTVDHVSTTKILNAISYVNSVLKEWGENIHYLHLHAALIGPNVDEINSVFDKTIEEIEHWQKKLIKQLSMRVVDEVKAKSMPYRHDNWVSMPQQNSKEPFMLSPTAGEMFQLLVSQLHELERDLSHNIFISVIRAIAQYLDDFFLDNMIMNTKFSCGGAAQFQYDITRNLFPLFGQYVRKPNQLFKYISDSCILLSLPLGSAILLNESLKTETSLDKIKKILNDICVINLNHVTASDILERRIDICV